MNLLDNLTKLMKEKNINRTELAREIGIAPSTVNSWYNRSYENISLKTLLKLSRFFNITIEKLVHGNTNEITFTEKTFTKAELNAIVNFGEFLINNREPNEKLKVIHNNNVDLEIIDFKELEKELYKHKHHDVG